MGKGRNVKLEVRATLVLNSDDFKRIDEFSLEELGHKLEEIKQTSAAVTIHHYGTLRGVIRFTNPTGYELKVARLESLGETADGGE